MDRILVLVEEVVRGETDGALVGPGRLLHAIQDLAADA